ncbi:bacterioferritin-associated ferredoxin [Marmoricola sp. URHB0036]|uniref:(2Fe-2S)-binding protein n=1 Tax=Marmoricola sp. URHB0036 TaxID=1298863 RepID=UPI0004206B2C|nr:(2Fe-2S)-binding protein [Marmoricola sp. URHB0036]
MIFCHCAVVGDREVAEAVAAGADTVASVCKATGAGQQCGSCIFSVRRVLCDHQAKGQASASAPDQGHPAPAIGVQVAAS